MSIIRDVIVLGAGPAGLAAALSASENEADVCIIEREKYPGGILKQCIHDGFGLIQFKERLTGPEYAWRFENLVKDKNINFYFNTFITKIEKTAYGFELTAVNPSGMHKFQTKTLVSATGCRERTDRQIFIHGDRPAGIINAGTAQNLINLQGLMPGRKCVILGSGDIGLIMARRLTLEGAEVIGVYEIGSEASGLNRNIAQCLEDFNIPLHLNATVTRVYGKKRVTGIHISHRDANGNEIRTEDIDCDCLILSVGLIPENDLIAPLGVEICPTTRGPVVNQYLESSVPGLFVCGNALQVYDLVDYVSESGKIAGFHASERSYNRLHGADTNLILNAGSGISQLVPQRVDLPLEDDLILYYRYRKSSDLAELILKDMETPIYTKKVSWNRPSEMERIIIPKKKLSGSVNRLTLYLNILRENGVNE